jgi:hypothetical protein
LFTVTTTGADVVALPAASTALAASVWIPFVTVVVSQVMAYGADATAAPRSAPSRRN